MEEPEESESTWIFHSKDALGDTELLSTLAMPDESRVARLDSRLWGSLAVALRDIKRCLGQEAQGADSNQDNARTLVTLLCEHLCASDAVLNITVEAGRRATVKVVCSVLQCVEAACEKLVDQGEVGTILAVLQGFNKTELEGTSVWGECSATCSPAPHPTSHAFSLLSKYHLVITQHRVDIHGHVAVAPGTGSPVAFTVADIASAMAMKEEIDDAAAADADDAMANTEEEEGEDEGWIFR